MRTRLLTLVLVLLVAALPVCAHVGSPDVFYEGNAGPYHLFVTVRMPQVIPGVAVIEVRSESGDVRAIQVVPLRLSGEGSKFPPTPDLAQQSKDDPQFFTASLWLMEFGALQVRILADGAKGKGEISVPVASFAQRTLPMQKSLGVVLLLLTLFLAVGMVSIVGAGSREGKLESNEVAGPSHLRRARRTMAITAVFVAAILYLGNAWWGVEARSYQRDVNFFKPPAAEATLQNGNRLVIRTRGQDRDWADYASEVEVVPDHNHLMHLFLIGVPAMDRMWHLHPEKTKGWTFVQDLPTMPAGHYQIFADVVDQRGFPWTLVGSVDIPQVDGKPLAGDDSSWSGAPLASPAADANVAQLPGGGRIVWQRDASSLKASVASNFKFRVEDKNGKPAQDLEPYMGMAGHAEFVRSDLSVFAHVHPAGSVSMAALALAQEGLPVSSSTMRDAVPGSMQDGMTMPLSSAALPPEVSFPYGFPQPGEYRVFVQIKRAGRVETGAFDAHVQ